MAESKNSQNNIVGMFYIVLGLVLIAIVAGEILFRLALAIGGLFIINYGMRMRGKPSLMATASRAFFGGFRFR